jgi:tRNA pseudouridine38-40 synthase
MKYKLVFKYDGTNYAGYAKQNGQDTIEARLEYCLSTSLKSEIKVNASGRTDKGVHALHQVCDFKTDENIKDLEVYRRRLNRFLPKDIYVSSIEKVNDDFDSRFSTKSKTYLYLIDYGEYDPIRRNYVFFENRLDFKKMEEASKLYLGKHNFMNFTSKEKDEADGFVREIFSIDFVDDKKTSTMEIYFKGNGFMRYEVRKLVGVLIKIGLGDLDIKDVQILLDKRPREIVSYTAESSALYLYDVEY